MTYEYDFDQSIPEDREPKARISGSPRPEAPCPDAQSPEAPDLSPLTEAFRDQLLACLEECAAGRHGLFTTQDYLGEASRHQPWPEAEQLRQLAFALQSILAQQANEYEQPGPMAKLIDQFLDLCSIHGESDPGEPRLARAFLAEIAAGGPA
jgi:hypothetical protein